MDVFLSERFLPGLKQVPGVRSLSVSEGDLMGPAGPQIPYVKVIAASFGSLGDAMAARQTPAGQSVQRGAATARCAGADARDQRSSTCGAGLSSRPRARGVRYHR